MSLKLIADSCCDTTPELREKLDISLIPLSITVSGAAEVIDTLDIDTEALLENMERSDGPVRTACPSIEYYAEEMRRHEESVVITLSSKLSGSYNSACAARDLILEESPEKKIDVLDSRSAAAGELSTALYIDALRAEGEPFERIVLKAKRYIKSMRTFFVLEDLSNLVKNGRMGKVKGLLASVLSIRPVLCDNRDGEIVMMHVVRGLANAHNRLVESIATETKASAKKSVRLVISYCRCLQTAQEIRKKILRLCPAIRDVTLVPTSGLSTAYAARGGIITAFSPT